MVQIDIDTLEVEKVRAIMSDANWDDLLQRAMGRATAKLWWQINNRYKEFVSGWLPKDQIIKLEVKKKTWKDSTGIVLYTNSMPFVIVAVGRRPGPIDAKNPDGMRFRKMTRASTTPGSLRSGTRQEYGPWRRVFHIDHPGITARRPDETIVKMDKEVIATIVAEAVIEQLHALFIAAGL